MLGGRIAPVNIADLPFNRLIGIAPSQKEGCVLSLPNDVRYPNPPGPVHACALIAWAEATSGDYLIKESAGVEFEVIAVVRRLEAKFRKPACGAVPFTITVPTAKKEEIFVPLGEKRPRIVRASSGCLRREGIARLGGHDRVVCCAKGMKTPYQPSDPTIASVTPPAGQEPRPD